MPQTNRKCYTHPLRIPSRENSLLMPYRYDSCDRSEYIERLRSEHHKRFTSIKAKAVKRDVIR